MLPNLIIIGAMKCGTSSLHYYLDRHPQVVMTRRKELDFFVGQRNWSRGLDWYRSQFSGDAVVHGESSPNYTYHPVFPGVPERMKAVVPGARLIYVLRDPIERIVSHYLHNCSEWRAGYPQERRGFVEAVSDPADRDYATRSCYGMQLEQYLAHYSRSAILVITAEELALQRRETLQRVFRFLGIDDTFDCPDFSRMRNRGADKQHVGRLGTWVLRAGRVVFGRHESEAFAKIGMSLVAPLSRPLQRPVVDGDFREKLVGLLQDDVGHLRELTGQMFEHWSL